MVRELWEIAVFGLSAQHCCSQSKHFTFLCFQSTTKIGEPCLKLTKEALSSQEHLDLVFQVNALKRVILFYSSSLLECLGWMPLARST